MHAKLKQVQGERTRICNILDGKCHELTDAQKEIERLKEELSMREVKLKWTQNKLKTELEGQKENQQKLEKALVRKISFIAYYFAGDSLIINNSLDLKLVFNFFLVDNAYIDLQLIR